MKTGKTFLGPLYKVRKQLQLFKQTFCVSENTLKSQGGSGKELLRAFAGNAGSLQLFWDSV